MRSKISTILAVLFGSTCAMAAIFPTGPTQTVGSFVMVGNSTAEKNLTNTGSLITLVAGVTGANRYGTFRVALGGTTGYTPANGKKFVSTGIKLWNGNATASQLYISSCDADVGMAVTTPAPTNPVYPGNNINAIQGWVPAAAAGALLEIGGGFFQIPNGKYGCLDNGASGAETVLLYGYEQ